MQEEVQMLGYASEIGDQIYAWSKSWEDWRKNTVLSSWGTLLDADLRERSSLKERVDLEQKICRELVSWLRKGIVYDQRWFEVDDSLRYGRGQCLSYVQLYIIIGRSMGLNVMPIHVIQVDDKKSLMSGQSHLACQVTLSDGSIMQVDVPPNGRISKPFEFVNVYQAQGHYWLARNQSNSKYFYNIQLMDSEGLLAHLLNNRGRRIASLGQHDQAIQLYSEAITRNSDTAEFFNNRAVSFLQLGNINEALADSEQAMTINPSLAEALNTRGVIRFKQGDIDKALLDFEKALSIKPEFSKAKRNHLLVMKRQKKLNVLGHDITQTF